MNPDPRIAVCPGSYDPITFGHLDVIGRASELFDEVVVAVVNLPIRKGRTLFDIDERLAFIESATEHMDNVRAEPFDVLVVEFAQRIGARAIVKGLRAISDFEYEMEMNQLNRRQAPDIDTLYLMASPQYSFLSSSGVKELATFGGRIEDLVPTGVAERLKEELARERTEGTAMDVLVLIDKLDDLVHNAKPVPLTDQVRVDKEEIYDLLDQMRATIPEEIKQARWIVKERQEMLAEAKREAERIVKEARERQNQLVSDEEVTKQAERASEDIIEDARAREREIRLGAEDYADEILNTLEVNLSKFIVAVQRGRERLQGKDEPAEVA